jgi:hypothetical protein
VGHARNRSAYGFFIHNFAVSCHDHLNAGVVSPLISFVNFERYKRNVAAGIALSPLRQGKKITHFLIHRKQVQIPTLKNQIFHKTFPVSLNRVKGKSQSC